MMWLVGYSPGLPSNLGMVDGSLVGMFGQVASCNIGSFVSFIKSRRFNEAKYGKLGGGHYV
jgi:hypothetical protein